MARRGFARVQAAEGLAAAWRKAAGEALARQTRVGQVRRGTLEVLVANSTLMQELGYRREALLADLARLAPDEGIAALRFRVGRVD
jgi:predicted nucleic acid-binding Zn ribbon protein